MKLFKRLSIRSLTKKLKALKEVREHNQVSDEAIAKEINLYMELSGIYYSLRKNKKFPFAKIMFLECLRAAASLGFPNAQYELGQLLLEEAKFRDNIEKEELFANNSNQRQSIQLYEEALAFLQSAEKFGHVLAKRLHGLCYINGWGVEIQKEKGFEMVMASISQENSWDKIPQIFASIGLNKPEFFSALGKHKQPNE